MICMSILTHIQAHAYTHEHALAFKQINVFPASLNENKQKTITKQNETKKEKEKKERKMNKKWTWHPRKPTKEHRV